MQRINQQMVLELPLVQHQEVVSHILNREKASLVSANAAERSDLIPPTAKEVALSSSATFSAQCSDKENTSLLPYCLSLTLTGCSGVTITFDVGK